MESKDKGFVPEKNIVDDEEHNGTPVKTDGMAPEARRDLVLEFMAEYQLPLPPLAVWGGLNQRYRVTFVYRTLNNILRDLADSGDLIRVDTKILREEGEIQAIEEDESVRRKAYYYITEQGRERASD